MATSAATVIQRQRRFLNDWPQNDSLTASCGVNATTLTVADSTLYAIGWLVQVDSEIYQVKAKPSGTTLTVFPGARGSTSASHANSTAVLINPRFTDLDYLEATNSAIQAAWPLLFIRIVDESLSTVATTYEYTIPAGPDGTVIRAISSLSFKESADLAFRKFGAWKVVRGATPVLKLRRPLPTGTLRIYGFSPFPPLSGLSASLDTQYPVNAEDYLTLYAAQYLTASGEAYRVRQDTGPNDDRESANRPGSSIQLSSQLFARARQRLIDSALPPMPKAIEVVL